MDLQECPGDCDRLNMHAVFSKKLTCAYSVVTVDVCPQVRVQ